MDGVTLIDDVTEVPLIMSKLTVFSNHYHNRICGIARQVREMHVGISTFDERT